MRKNLLVILIMAILITGCKVTMTADERVDVIKVYNPFEYTFDNYVKSGRVPVEKLAGKPSNLHQFSFATKSSLFTSGDSYNNGFEIIEYKEGQLETRYRLRNSKTDAIFPLAEDEQYTLFFVADYSKSGLPVSKVVRFHENQLYTYHLTEGLINKGAIIDAHLYYTVYDPKTDRYDLLKLKLDGYENKPELIEAGIVSGDVFVFNNQLAKTSENKIIYKNHQFDKASINYYDNDYGKLIQMNPNSENNNQLQLKVIDVEHETVEVTIENVVGIDFNTHTLKVFCVNETRTLTFDGKLK